MLPVACIDSSNKSLNIKGMINETDETDVYIDSSGNLHCREIIEGLEDSEDCNIDGGKFYFNNFIEGKPIEEIEDPEEPKK